MEPKDTRTHILIDSARRLAKSASWYRRQRGRKEKEYQRIANAITAEAQTKVDELHARADKGDEDAIVMLPMLPDLAVQPPLV